MKNHKFKELVHYLHSKGLYVQFRFNFQHYDEEKSKPASFWSKERKEIFYNNGCYPISQYIDHAFKWADTKEGSNFWYSKYTEAYEQAQI